MIPSFTNGIGFFGGKYFLPLIDTLKVQCMHLAKGQAAVKKHFRFHGLPSVPTSGNFPLIGLNFTFPLAINSNKALVFMSFQTFPHQ
ncbi:MAG: hypothetical protein Q4A89_00825 [Tannerella sp.]|nr:hypothetical protein [Tannerella sp.]